MFSCCCIYYNTQRLNTYNSKTKLFSFEGKIKYAKVVKVYDGDTIQVVFKTQKEYYRFKCRLNRIDTPEIKSRNLSEKQKAIVCRDILKNIILNKIVKVRCGKFDKYGRILIELFYNNTNMNDWLIKKNYAVKYSGGTKQKWT